MNNDADEFVMKYCKNFIDPDTLIYNINQDMPSNEQHIKKLSVDLASGIPGILYLIDELEENYGFTNKDIYIDNYIELLLSTLKGSPKYDISLFGGLPGIAMSLVSLKRPDLTNVINQINEVIFQLIDYFIEKVSVTFANRSSYFDWMYGLSGTLNYLCFYSENMNRTNKRIQQYIQRIQQFFIANYLQSLTINNKSIYPWYISQDNQMSEIDKIEYPFGNYNISLSHGISGMLLALTESQNINYDNKVYILQKNIAEFLLENMNVINEYPIWPLAVSLDEKHNISQKQEINRFDSWCYGSPGILISLLNFAEQEKNKKLQKFCIDSLVSLNDHNEGLSSPIICHGYSGLLAILLCIKRKYKRSFSINRNILKNIMSYEDVNLKLGFLDKRYISDSAFVLTSDPGILNGTTGILLSMILVNHDSASGWTKIFGI